jgi:hypothetical protein
MEPRRLTLRHRKLQFDVSSIRSDWQRDICAEFVSQITIDNFALNRPGEQNLPSDGHKISANSTTCDVDGKPMPP